MSDTRSLIANPSEHPFAPFVRILGKGKTGSRSLTMEEAHTAMGMIMRGEVEDVQLGAFLMLLRVKEESPKELAGFVQAVRESIAAPALQADLDWASYAGKKQQLHWYLLAALALANAGYRVFMHGTAGHTAGRIYSEDVLKFLGVPVAENWNDVATHLDSQNFTFLPLRHFSAPLQRIIDLRNHFGLRSPVHTLARLLNPLSASCSMQSIFHPSYASSHQQAAMLLGQPHAAVFKGEAGEVERKPEAVTSVHYVHDAQASEVSWPRLRDGRQTKLAQLDLDILRNVWRGEQTDDYGEQAVVGTMAIALHMMQAADTPDSAMSQAESLWSQRRRDFL